MEIKLLRYFIAVAEELHFTRAAARLHIAQPALSHQIREFERIVGTPLFRRTRRSVQLTEAGALLLPEARAIVERTEAAAQLLARAGSGKIGKIEIGFILGSAGDLLPKAVLAYRARFPDVEVRLNELDTAEQITGLSNESLDVGMIHDFVDVPSTLRFVVLNRDALVVALPAGHRLARRARVALTDLEPETFVLNPVRTHPFGDLIRSACTAAGFAPRTVETAALTSRLALVAAGCGITIVASSATHLWARSVIYRPLSGHGVKINRIGIWNPARSSPTITAFIGLLKELARSKKSTTGSSGHAD